MRAVMLLILLFVGVFVFSCSTINVGLYTKNGRFEVLWAPTKVQKRPQKERNPEVVSFHGRFSDKWAQNIPAIVRSSP